MGSTDYLNSKCNLTNFYINSKCKITNFKILKFSKIGDNKYYVLSSVPHSNYLFFFSIFIPILATVDLWNLMKNKKVFVDEIILAALPKWLLSLPLKRRRLFYDEEEEDFWSMSGCHHYYYYYYLFSYFRCIDCGQVFSWLTIYYHNEKNYFNKHYTLFWGGFFCNVSVASELVRFKIPLIL